MSAKRANESIKKVQDAIEIAASWRNEFGAVQEQLEHAAKNVDNTAEYTQSSESNIRDTDMGEEVLKYSKNQILVNASQSLLAQYNKNPQATLILLE